VARMSSRVERGTQTAVRVDSTARAGFTVTTPLRSGNARVMVYPSLETPRSRTASVRLNSSVHRWPRLSRR
jgi:hypothetical protein